jgi:hypothetical protein
MTPPQVDTEKIIALISKLEARIEASFANKIEAIKSDILSKVSDKCVGNVKNFIVNENHRQTRQIELNVEKMFAEIGEKVENVCKRGTNVFA